MYGKTHSATKMRAVKARIKKKKKDEYKEITQNRPTKKQKKIEEQMNTY